MPGQSFNRFRSRNRRSRQFSKKTGKRKYAGAKRLRRLAKRARFRRSARAQSRQIRKLAGTLADTKGTFPVKADALKEPPSEATHSWDLMTALNTAAVGLASVPIQYAIGKYLDYQNRGWRSLAATHELRSGRMYSTYV